MLDLVHLIKYMRQVSCLFVIMLRKYGVLKIFNAAKNIQNRAMRYYLVHKFTPIAGVIGSDVPWLDCPASNAITWVITFTE